VPQSWDLPALAAKWARVAPGAAAGTSSGEEAEEEAEASSEDDDDEAADGTPLPSVPPPTRAAAERALLASLPAEARARARRGEYVVVPRAARPPPGEEEGAAGGATPAAININPAPSTVRSQRDAAYASSAWVVGGCATDVASYPLDAPERWPLCTDHLAALDAAWQWTQPREGVVAWDAGESAAAPPATASAAPLPLPSRAALQRLAIAADVARAVAHLHSFRRPILHRDLKSHNVFLTRAEKEAEAGGGQSQARGAAAAAPWPLSPAAAARPARPRLSLRAVLGDFGEARAISEDEDDRGGSTAAASRGALAVPAPRSRSRLSRSSAPAPLTGERGTPQWMAGEVSAPAGV
jgi:hypothetical protein